MGVFLPLQPWPGSGWFALIWLMCAVQSYAATIVVAVAESVGGVLDVFDLAVEAFGAGVGDLSAEKHQHRGPPGLDGLGQRGELGDVGVGAPGVEVIEPGGDLVAVAAAGGSMQ
jgi:hypothetical protein